MGLSRDLQANWIDVAVAIGSGQLGRAHGAATQLVVRAGVVLGWSDLLQHQWLLRDAVMMFVLPESSYTAARMLSTAA